MKKIIVALTLAILSQTVIAAEWYLVAVSNADYVLIDKQSLTRSGNIVKYWDWSVRLTPTGTPSSDNEKALSEANCKDRTIRYISMQNYLQSNPAGPMVTMSGRWIQIIPDTVREAIYKAVCKGSFPGKGYRGLTIEQIQNAMREDNSISVGK